MTRIAVYKVKAYNIEYDEYRVSRRMATEKGAVKMCGEILKDTVMEIDVSRLEHGEEWTDRDFVP